MLPRSFYFLRHGETDWNRERRLQGWTDIPLNETGRQQAETVLAVLSRQPIDLIVSSPLSRALETARIVNRILQKPLHVDEGLKERGFGVIEGKTYEEMRAHREEMSRRGAPLEESGYPCPDEGEPYEGFKLRTAGAMSRHLAQYEGQNVLFVSHGGVYRVLQRALLGLEGHSPNAAPFYFEKRAEGWHQATLI